MIATSSDCYQNLVFFTIGFSIMEVCQTIVQNYFLCFYIIPYPLETS
ncbi:hypothetical protein GmarT_57310 [Gimesia maris]|uniref:Uncharacterized protein n=1 Tax=Gimesia maris TaxID=122 RepID=A0ABX5YZ62_9PLAN|nr:hypothetical protein Mal35_55490 [Gimesia maris]QDU17802.1 hypothetical protein CA11_56510 [Gimesia maris]QEG19824.1 hypothetical protein GmarT_57310 [Gimesia maris]